MQNNIRCSWRREAHGDTNTHTHVGITPVVNFTQRIERHPDRHKICLKLTLFLSQLLENGSKISM